MILKLTFPLNSSLIIFHLDTIFNSCNDVSQLQRIYTIPGNIKDFYNGKKIYR